MIATCKICGAMIDRAPAPADLAAAAPVIGEGGARAVMYQAAIQGLAEHVGLEHPEYWNVLGSTAQTYHLHLIAKLALSTDAEFLDEREAARALCYWTLAGELEFTKPTPPNTPDSRR